MHRLSLEPTVVGTKQTIRALEKGKVTVLYLAKDAHKQVTLRALELAEKQNVPVVYVNTMEELALACKVEVETATAALIKN